MLDYHERLRVPILWWVIMVMCVLILGTELFAGFPLWVGVIVYIVLALICTATMLHWGGAVVRVRDGELRAATARVPLAEIGEVRPLDPPQTRAMRGPRSDPKAYLLVRPYLKESVYVELPGEAARWPYLLVATRRPVELAAAIERSRMAMAGQHAAGPS